MNLLEMGFIEVVGLRTPSLYQESENDQFQRNLHLRLLRGLLNLSLFSVLVYFRPGFLSLFLDSKIEPSGIEVPSHFIYKTQTSAHQKCP